MSLGGPPQAPGRRAFLRGDWLRGATRAPAHAAPAAGAIAPSGRATVLPHACLAFQGVMCDLCVTACSPQKALVIRNGRPTLLAERCDGCGECQRVCPAPGGGVLVVGATPPAAHPRRR